MPSIRPTPLRISHHIPWQLYIIAIIHHGRLYTMAIIHHGQGYIMAIVHHGRGRYTCTPCLLKVQSSAIAYDRILSSYYWACYAGLGMTLLCTGVNTSDVFLLCQFRGCIFVFLAGKYTVRNSFSTDGAKLRKRNISETPKLTPT